MDSETLAILQGFADRHELTLTLRGECGFGRPCVGFLKGDSYVEFNPYDMASLKAGEPVTVFPYDRRLSPPKDVPNAYHKHDCLAVLAVDDDEPDYEAAARELAAWVRYLESWGPLEVTRYRNGYSHPIELMMHGTHSHALRFTDGKAWSEGMSPERARAELLQQA